VGLRYLDEGHIPWIPVLKMKIWI